MCSLVRYHEHLFCQFPFTKCLYFLNLSCISASAFIHLLCYCIKYQTYQNICMNQLFPPTRITTLSASQDASMIDLLLIYDWQRIFSMRRVSGHGYTFRVDKHLHSEDFSIEDYYFRAKSSPFGRIRLQRLFFPRWIHPYSEESSSRDYFLRIKSSPHERIRLQGLFSRGEFISVQKNPPPGMLW